jgi:hypothetical protein
MQQSRMHWAGCDFLHGLSEDLDCSKPSLAIISPHHGLVDDVEPRSWCDRRNDASGMMKRADPLCRSQPSCHDRTAFRSLVGGHHRLCIHRPGESLQPSPDNVDPRPASPDLTPRARANNPADRIRRYHPLDVQRLWVRVASPPSRLLARTCSMPKAWTMHVKHGSHRIRKNLEWTAQDQRGQSGCGVRDDDADRQSEPGTGIVTMNPGTRFRRGGMTKLET